MGYKENFIKKKLEKEALLRNFQDRKMICICIISYSYFCEVFLKPHNPKVNIF